MKTPFVRHLHCPVLRRSVVVAVGPRDALRPLFLKAFRGFETTPAMLKEIWARLEAEVARAYEEYPQCQGTTTRLDGDVYIVMPKWSRSVFVHEAYHATKAVLRELDTDDEELGAYVLEWICEEICGRDDPPCYRKKEKRR